MKAVLFDLDGTLIDHFRTIFRCYEYAQQKMGLPVASFEKLKRTVGGSIYVTMERLVGKEHYEQGVVYFKERFEEIWAEDLEILPGAEWILRELHGRGTMTAIFTNKHGGPSRRIAAHLGIDDVLTEVIGTGDTAWRKPMPEFSRYALEKLGVSSDEACLIGDSPWDVQAANSVGMPCYTVATGSHDLDALSQEDCAGAYANLFDLGRDIFGLEVPLAEA